MVDGLASILGFTLLAPAARYVELGPELWLEAAVRAWAWAGVLGFFVGSLLFVRACFRGRKQVGLRVGCAIYHTTRVGLAWSLAPGLALAFAPGLFRTGLLLARRLRPMIVGVTEILTTVLFVVLFLRLEAG